MNTYHVVQAGVGFEIVQTLPNGRISKALIGFVTETGAREWLQAYLRFLVRPDSTRDVFDADVCLD